LTAIVTPAIGRLELALRMLPKGLEIEWLHKPPPRDKIERTNDRLVSIESTPANRNWIVAVLLAVVGYLILSHQ
jgi:hypothetical protein